MLLFSLIALSSVIPDFELYLDIAQQHAASKLNELRSGLNPSDFCVDGNTTEIEFLPGHLQYACAKESNVEHCLTGSIRDQWDALIARDPKLQAQVYTGPLYRADDRRPLRALRFLYGDQMYLRKEPDDYEELIDISQHLKVGSSLYTSAASEHNGTICFLQSIMNDALSDAYATEWIDKDMHQVVTRGLPSGMFLSRKLHPQFMRVYFTLEYYGNGTGAKNYGKQFLKEEEVTTIGYQPTSVRYIGVFFPPSTIKDKDLIADDSSFNQLILTTDWIDLTSPQHN